MSLTSSATTLADARLFHPDVYEDDRGFFKEVYSAVKYLKHGIPDEFVQDSVSFSAKNVIRGLHADVRMSKLATVLRGRVWDVIVDLRIGSPTYCKWEGFYLSEHNHAQLYVPRGFAHGFLALTDDVVFSYKHGALHDPQFETSYRWDDPRFGIVWPLVGEPRLSRKDRGL